MIDPASLPEDLLPIAWTVHSGNCTRPAIPTFIVPDSGRYKPGRREEVVDKEQEDTNGSSSLADHCAGLDLHSRSTIVFRSGKHSLQLEKKLRCESHQPTVEQMSRELHSADAKPGHQRKVNGENLSGMVASGHDGVPGQDHFASDDTRILMGIAHQTRPHYGVQVMILRWWYLNW